MDETCGLEDDLSDAKLRNIFSKVSAILHDSDISSINELLEKAEVSENDYNDALRFSLKGDTIVAKRNLSEIFINFYNSSILKAWKANMDIQENL